MDSLTELYNQQIVPLDHELEKQATEMVKQAEEEEFAGRIMARGFADELNKLAGDPMALKYPGKAPGQGTTNLGSLPTTRKSALPPTGATPAPAKPMQGAVTGNLKPKTMAKLPGQKPVTVASR